jgi:hypothetical protein
MIFRVGERSNLHTVSDTGHLYHGDGLTRPWGTI